MRNPATGPDGTLRLEREGPNGHALLRAFIALILSGFAIMPPVVLYAFSDGNPWAPLLALPVFTVFPWYPMLFGFAWFLGEALGSWRWIEVDEDDREVRGRRDAFLLWGSRRIEIPADAIRSLRVLRVHPDGVPEGGYSQIRVVHHGRKWLLVSGEKDTFLTFYRDEHGRRADFLEFVFRVGRMLGFPGYRLARDHDLRMEVELLSRVGGEGIRRVPDPAGSPAAAVETGIPTGTRGPRAVEPAPVPPRDLPAFEPEALDSSHEIETWEPGRLVAVEKRGLSTGHAVWASVAGTILFNLPTLVAGGLILTGEAEDVSLFWRVVVVAVFLLVTFLVNAFIWTEGRSRRRAVFDWREQRCRFAKDGREVEVPLTAIDEVQLRGLRHGRPGDDAPSYSCEVRIRTPGGTGLVARTSTTPDPEGSYTAAAPMAEDLADSLGIQWRWTGWEERTTWDAVSRLARSLWARYGPQERAADRDQGA